jgi:hypothetical protein
VGLILGVDGGNSKSALLVATTEALFALDAVGAAAGGKARLRSELRGR